MKTPPLGDSVIDRSEQNSIRLNKIKNDSTKINMFVKTAGLNLRMERSEKAKT